MDKYNELIGAIESLKTTLMVEHDEKSKVLKQDLEDIHQTNLNITDLDSQIFEAKKTYEKLSNYKNLKRKLIKNVIKGFIGMFASILLVLFIMMMLAKVASLNVLTKLAITSFGLSAIFGITSEWGNIAALIKLKRNNPNVNEFSLFIKRLEGRLRNLHFILGTQTEHKRQTLEDINDLDNKIQLCDSYLASINERLLMVSAVCRDDVEAINEVFASENYEPIMKLVREKDETN